MTSTVVQRIEIEEHGCDAAQADRGPVEVVAVLTRGRALADERDLTSVPASHIHVDEQNSRNLLQDRPWVPGHRNVVEFLPAERRARLNLAAVQAGPTAFDREAFLHARDLQRDGKDDVSESDGHVCVERSRIPTVPA